MTTKKPTKTTEAPTTKPAEPEAKLPSNPKTGKPAKSTETSQGGSTICNW